MLEIIFGVFLIIVFLAVLAFVTVVSVDSWNIEEELKETVNQAVFYNRLRQFDAIKRAATRREKNRARKQRRKKKR